VYVYRFIVRDRSVSAYVIDRHRKVFAYFRECVQVLSMFTVLLYVTEVFLLM